ncbi:MAG: hypothetical protein AB7P33_06030, partial [Dehalococcoidia bacterium]
SWYQHHNRSEREPMMLQPLDFDAPPDVRDALAAMGRTEDVALSPGGGRLAIAEFARNRILVLEVEREERLTTGRVVLSRFVELSSPRFRSPHGLCFLDEDILVVASREGTLTLHRLPALSLSTGHLDSSPIQTIRPGLLRQKVTPGSVATLAVGPSEVEMLVCNNYQNTVTRHLLDPRRNYRSKTSHTLLQRRLDVPDGVAVSPDGRWIAISNHSTYTVLVFENGGELNPQSEPAGILTNVECPHGLKFTGDGGALLVASAATPFIHVFERDALVDGLRRDDWLGMRAPAGSLQVMDDETYQRGRTNDEEGGPKGLVVSTDLNLVATTSEFQPLAFFELQTLLQTGTRARATEPA